MIKSHRRDTQRKIYRCLNIFSFSSSIWQHIQSNSVPPLVIPIPPHIACNHDVYFAELKRNYLNVICNMLKGKHSNFKFSGAAADPFVKVKTFAFGKRENTLMILVQYAKLGPRL